MAAAQVVGFCYILIYKFGIQTPNVLSPAELTSQA